jgi:hypothetical protein
MRMGQHLEMTVIGNERAAFVLAGHALGAHLYGLSVVRMSIVAPEDADSWIDVEEPILPTAECFVEEQDRIAARALIISLLAGPAAGQRYSFGECGTELENCRDLLADRCVWRAANLARRFRAGYSTLHLLWRGASEIIDSGDHWSVIEKLAIRLLDHGEINGEEMQKLFSNCL